MTIKEVSEKYNITQDTLRYYERSGMIPKVTRTQGGIRNYTEEDIRWVELAICMRSAGLPVEVMCEYVRLFQEGEETIPARLELLLKQRNTLLEQRKQIDETLERFQEMTDAFLEAGGTYFDTAYPYHGGFSERAFREVVVKRYPRERYTITDKMPMYLLNKPEQMQEILKNSWSVAVWNILIIIGFMRWLPLIMKRFRN